MVATYAVPSKDGNNLTSRHVIIECCNCGATVEIDASALDEETGSIWRAPKPLRVMGWKRLPKGCGDYEYRCPDCRLDIIESCPTVFTEAEAGCKHSHDEE